MNNGKMRTILKLVWYLRPGRETFRKAARYSVAAAYFLPFFPIFNSAGKRYGNLIFILLLMMIIPLLAAYSASGDLRSLLHRAEDRKSVLYDFENSSRYVGGEARLGEMFLFPRKGEIPFPCRSIRRIDLEWVTGRGYGLVITLFGGMKLVFSETGAGTLTRGEGRERYQSFIRDLLRRSPGIACEFGEKEGKFPFLNGNDETGKTLKKMIGYEMWDYIRPSKGLWAQKVQSLFSVMICLILPYGFLYMLTQMPRTIFYLVTAPPALVTYLSVLYFTIMGLKVYTVITEIRTKSRDFELRMQRYMAEGRAEEMIKDFKTSVPFFDGRLLFGNKYLFLRQTGKIFEYSRITKVQHTVIIQESVCQSHYLYKITEKDDQHTIDQIFDLLRFIEYYTSADAELKKKNPGIVFALWED